MIQITGQARRYYTFPADPDSAFIFFQDFERVIEALPHIERIRDFPENPLPNACRLRYHSTELGMYGVNIYCDLYTHSDAQNRCLYVHPLEDGVVAVESEVSWYSISAQGIFSSISRFDPQGDHTRIDYSLSLRASIPVPRALRPIPRSALQGIANNIVARRIEYIADGFMMRCIHTYQSLISTD